MRRLVATADQTTGPFFPAQFIRRGDSDLAGGTGRRAAGEAHYVFGQVCDADAKPAVNVIIEIWQASAAGRFDDPDFFGWGRTWTDREGFYSFTTVKPGPYPVRPGGNRWFAPRISMRLLGSGLMRPLLTCLYFPGEALNATDPQLVAIRSLAARKRLIAAAAAHASAPPDMRAVRFDLCLGGRKASTFLEG
ncbi:MAG TPA: protocatechuate 3,4-dioxygenase subunit beta [Methylomirabilota bacterium]|nr:protocatechuate 3,4-dioxygenase subunit beta [Methylomirabilota bacterium]